MSSRSRLLLLPILLASCGEAPDSSAHVLVRDSAGTRIVANEIAKREPLVLGLGGTELVIGREDDPAHAFHEIRGAYRLRDGRIVVVDGGSSQVRLFGSRGDFHGAVGRPGGGPHEFRLISWSRRLGTDSLLLYDGRLRKLAVVDPHGAIVDELIVPPVPAAGASGGGPIGPDAPITLLPDGSVLLHAPGVFQMHGQEGLRTIRVAVLRMASSEAADTLLTMPFLDFFEAPDKPLGIGRLAYPRAAAWTARNNRFCFTRGASYHVDCRAIDNHEGQISARVSASVRPVTSAEEDAYLARSSADPAEVTFPTHLPSYSRVMIDEGGWVWAEEYALAGDTVEWHVFTESGVLASVARVIPNTKIMDVDGGWITAVHTDSLGVETVVVWRSPVRPAHF